MPRIGFPCSGRFDRVARKSRCPRMQVVVDAPVRPETYWKGLLIGAPGNEAPPILVAAPSRAPFQAPPRMSYAMKQVPPTREESVQFWADTVAGIDLPTPLVVNAPGGGAPVRATHDVDLTAVAADGVDALLKESGATASTLCVALWAALLSRYADRDVVVVALDRDDGRTFPATVSVRGESVSRWLREVEEGLDAQRRHDLDVERIAEMAGVPAETMTSSRVLLGSAASVGDVALALRADVEELRLTVEYDDGQFRPGTIERLAGHLAVLLDGMVSRPNSPVAELPLLTEDERSLLLFDVNDTEHPFPRDRCFHHLVEESVDANPDAVAVVFGDQSLTYGELDERANRLAHHLIELGVAPDVPVGIFAERSLEMVVGIVGILKAGGAFTPLDPKYPAERLAFMMEDASAPVLLTQSHLRELISLADTRVVSLDADWAEVARGKSERPEVEMDPENLAYVIYTSGSTGRPKGVAIRHRGSVNNVHDLNTRYGVGADDRLLVLSSLSFDMCVYEVLGSLLAGATMVMPDPDRVGEPGHWAELVGRHGVSVWNSAPQLLEMFVDYTEDRPELHPRTLRLAILGGDWVPVSLPERFKSITAPDSRFVVLGGATECSIHSTIYEVEEMDPQWTSIPYGRPQWNQSCYVLDSRRRLCPVGVPGELHLGGEGLGRGYLHRPELTAEKFIPHPFSDASGARLYRTGDLVRMDETGLLELLGRIDFMVKVRGFRIELGEIEAVLRSHEAVKETVVMARDDEAGDRQLVAYVVPRTGGDGDGAAADEQVERWQEVYETTYAETAAAAPDPTFNIVGWNSSYTGEPIPAEDMRSWVENTVDRIAALGPERVLEIGCGTGLLLFRLAGRCERYMGTDFSASALKHVEEHKAAHGLDHVETLLREARDFSGLEAGSFDVVVLNSIVLQFPDVEYVVDVLRGAARLLRPGGAIFVGDVRHLPTLETYHSSVQLAQAPDEMGVTDVRSLVEQRMVQEEELLMDPEFFRAVVEEVDELDRCVVQVKRGAYVNELSKYRFDATLFRGGESRDRPHSPKLVEWTDDLSSVEDFRALATREAATTLVVRGVPNALLVEDLAAQELLGQDERTASDVREAAARHGKKARAFAPADLFASAGIDGYDVDVRLGPHAEPGTFDVVLRKGEPGTAAAVTIPVARAPRASVDLVNDPLRRERQRELVPALRRHAAGLLPDYMVPGAFVVLDRLPLTPNGKIDRKALPAPPAVRTTTGSDFVAPESALEQVLATTWAEVLGLERVGVSDGFFALGGHSLKATQIASRVRDGFGLQVPLRTLLEDPTVSSFARAVEALGEEQGVRVVDIAEVLVELQALSDEQVEEQLHSNGDPAMERSP